MNHNKEAYKNRWEVIREWKSRQIRIVHVRW
jgi:hypothetical protein